MTVSLQLKDDEGNRLIDLPSDLPEPDSELIRGEKWKRICGGLVALGGPCQEIMELR